MSSKALDFTISLADRFTGPLKGVSKKIEALEKITNKTTKTFQKIGIGGLALWGVGKAFNSLVAPAQEMQQALSLASLSGVKDLDAMRKQAKKFSGEYATSAVDFVNSSVLIKNSIAGITDRALPKVTEKMNLLAKATGVSVEDSTNYMSKMLDEYKSTATQMGGMNFIDQVSNMAAYAKQSFNMTPAQMQAMMQGSKGAGANYGVDMSEQFAVLGMLNQSLGSGGGGAYEKMLQNMQSAGKQLGLTFTDTNGKLLAMPEILEKLQSKFGKNIDGNIKAQEQLNKVFGSGAPAIEYLLKNTDALNSHLSALGKNNGLSLVQKMAEANVKLWDKITAKIENMKESIGRVLLPVFGPVFDFIDKVVGKLTRWLEMFPNLAKWIGIVAAAFMGLAAVGAVLSIVSGALSLMMSPIMLIVLGIIAIGTAGYLLWKNFSKIISWITGKWNAFLDLLDNFFVFKPIVFAIRNFGAIFDAIFKGVSFVWNTFINLVKDTVAFKAIAIIWSSLGDAFNAFIAIITGNWQGFIDIVTNNPIFKVFSGLLDGIVNVFSDAFRFIKNFFVDQINWFIDKLNYLPGVNIDLIERDEGGSENKILKGNKIDAVQQGGILQDIKNNTSQSVDNSKNINGVTIINKGGMTPEQLKEWEYLQNG
jgi:TP901 family phage tail tape measure protein